MKAVAQGIVFAVGVIAASQSQAAWEQIVGKRGEVVVYLDSETLRASGKLRVAWVLHDLLDAKPPSQMSLKTRLEVDCAGDRYRLTDSIAYSAPMGQGKVLDSVYGVTNAAWENAVPGSVSGGMQREICITPLKH